MVGRDQTDAGPGHVRSRTGLSPYEKVILRANHYVVETETNRSAIEIGAITSGIWWHRHYVPFPISLAGYSMVITLLIGANRVFELKMALFTADPTSGNPSSLVANTPATWQDADIRPSSPNNVLGGRYKKINPVLILQPGAYWVGLRPSMSGISGDWPKFRGEIALDPSFLQSEVGGADQMYDLQTSGYSYASDWPSSPPSVAEAKTSIANIAVGLLCNRLY